MRLIADRQGIADEQLKKVQHDRKRKADTDDLVGAVRKRSRSVSSYSSTSVSTISTNLSRSPSPKPAVSQRTSHLGTSRTSAGDHKKMKSPDSSMSYSSNSSYTKHKKNAPSSRDRNAQDELDRAHSIEWEKSDRLRPDFTLELSRKRRRSRSSSMSYISDSSYDRRRRSRSINDFRRTRARRSKASPDIRGRDRWSRAPRSSRSNSMDRDEIARGRRSMTPIRVSRGNGIELPRGRREDENTRPGSQNDNDRYGSSFRDKESEYRRPPRPRPASPPRKQRSLSPFSKRVALTQAMNMGR